MSRRQRIHPHQQGPSEPSLVASFRRAAQSEWPDLYAGFDARLFFDPELFDSGIL